MRTIRSTPPPAVAAQAARIRELLACFSRRRSLRDPIAASFEGSDLTPVQIHLLLWLGNDGAQTMGALARRVAVTEKTITGIVDRLERDGLVARERDPGDRRVVHVSLSPAGTALWKRIDAEINAKLVGFLELLEPADRRHLLRILEKLELRLAGAEHAPGPRAKHKQPRPTHAVRREEA